MALTPIYDLNTTTDVHEDHDILVYQGGQLKKLNSKDFLYSKDYIEQNIIKQKNDIIKALASLHVDISKDSSLWDCINAIDSIDLFEIGVRRLVHNGTSTETLYDNGTTAETNPKFKNTGIPQSSPELDRVYRIGDITTIIPKISAADRNANTDFLFADWSTSAGLKRNDFIGGPHDTTGRWVNGIYPWNKMKKVQIKENGTNDAEFNYDMSIDNGGSYFTEVPLYFIKNEIITDSGIDITDSWPIIPPEYQNQNIYEYRLVCKAMLPGYRPAEFFKSYENNITMVESETGSYIYLASIDCYYKPSVYSDGEKRYEKVIDSEVSTYTRFLDNKHYVACYEASSFEDEESGTYDTLIQSRPSTFKNKIFPLVRVTNNNMKDYLKATSSKYIIKDMRLHEDFFVTLMEIEFATINSQFSVEGAVELIYDNGIKCKEDATNTNSIKVDTDWFLVGQTISITTLRAGSGTYIADNRIITKIEIEPETNYRIITFNGPPVSVKTSYVVWSCGYACGYTDTDYIYDFVQDENGKYKFVNNDYEIAEDSYKGIRYSAKRSCGGHDYRTGVANGSYADTFFPIKWNWIENPWGNCNKILDGIKIRCDKDDNGLLENSYYICDNPELYTNLSIDDYGLEYKKLSYIGPSEFLNESGSRTTSKGYALLTGRDPRYPWARLTSKVSYRSNGYKDYYSENTYQSTEGTKRLITCGGMWNDGLLSGLHFFNLTSATLPLVYKAMSFSRKE